MRPTARGEVPLFTDKTPEGQLATVNPVIYEVAAIQDWYPKEEAKVLSALRIEERRSPRGNGELYGGHTLEERELSSEALVIVETQAPTTVHAELREVNEEIAQTLMVPLPGDDVVLGHLYARRANLYAALEDSELDNGQHPFANEHRRNLELLAGQQVKKILHDTHEVISQEVLSEDYVAPAEAVKLVVEEVGEEVDATLPLPERIAAEEEALRLVIAEIAAENPALPLAIALHLELSAAQAIVDALQAAGVDYRSDPRFAGLMDRINQPIERRAQTIGELVLSGTAA